MLGPPDASVHVIQDGKKMQGIGPEMRCFPFFPPEGIVDISHGNVYNQSKRLQDHSKMNDKIYRYLAFCTTHVF